MPATHDTPQLTLFRNGQARLSDLARRALLGKAAVILNAPSAVGGRWLLLPIEDVAQGAQPLYDDRGHKRFGAMALAVAVFALFPSSQKNVHLTLEPAPLGFWLVPSGPKHQKSELATQAA
jgi:hypothetical protein